MRFVKITETDHGQFVIESSAGTRSVGATLQTAVSKFNGAHNLDQSWDIGRALGELLGRVPSTPGPSQVHQGQASA